jgi:lipopolysaccharide transport system ATP-binding protein
MKAIEVIGLTKEYRLGQLAGLKHNVANLFRRAVGRSPSKPERFKALDDVSFEIAQGEVVGIIGGNGAGKSTLLKHLANITKPTRGRVIVRGSVAPLIEVGAGLNPELSGRENIFLNGAILGIPRKVIREKLDEIIEFSELSEFIDTPIKRYSSGMAVRLGFAIATSMDADILIVDEVLAVGDLAFQRKCFDRMEELIKRRGKTVLLVSHNIRQVERICSRVLLMDKGRLIKDGSATEVCNLFYERSNRKVQAQHRQSSLSGNTTAYDSGEISVEKIQVFHGRNDEETTQIPMHESIRVRIHYRVNKALVDPEFVVGFHTTDFVYLASASSASLETKMNISTGMHHVEVILDNLPLMPGVYCLRIAFLDQFRRIMWYGENISPFTVVPGNVDVSKKPEVGLIDLPFKWGFSQLQAEQNEAKAVCQC